MRVEKRDGYRVVVGGLVPPHVIAALNERYGQS